MTAGVARSGSIEYLRQGPGDGPAVVLLHGIGSHAGSFAPAMERLSPEWRVVAWNAPGYGGSAALDDEWPEARDYAVALEALLDRLGLERVVLGCHSLGCLIGAAFAARSSGRVSRLLLASPALGHGAPRGGALGEAAQARIDDLKRLGAEAFAAARAPRLVWRPDDNPSLVGEVRAAMARVNRRGYAQAARMLASGRLLDDLAGLRLPVDVVVGEQDVVTPPEAARRAHAAVAAPWRGALTMVPGCGHALCQQAPAAFAAALGAPAQAASERPDQETTR